MRYREAPMENDGLTILVSQSGETADTLASLRYARSAGQKIAAIVNVRESTIAREADTILPILAGPEIGVASTKAFTCQLSVLAALTILAGKQRGVIDAAEERRLVESLAEVPRHISSILRDEASYEAIAMDLSRARDVLYLGRGSSYPLAMEGALKLKEISYIHAEGYAAGELKHGPIALIDENVPVIVVAPDDELFEKTISNVQEVSARGGRIIFISQAEAERAGCPIHAGLQVPNADPFVNPLIYTVPVQLLAYHTAVHLGTDVDQPRNLAKSVTVE
jgi:glucosamine--fructose-6-phosphate aminotransferase (isomerizing)